MDFLVFRVSVADECDFHFIYSFLVYLKWLVEVQLQLFLVQTYFLFLFDVNIRTYFAVSKLSTTGFAVSLTIGEDLTTIGVGLTTTGSTF